MNETPGSLSTSSGLRRAARIGTRVLIGVVVALAVMAGIGAAGMVHSMRTTLRPDPVAAPAAGWPKPATAPPGRIAVAVVVGGNGAVVTDALAPYEVFARSPKFFVYTVSVRRTPIPLTGGLRVLPDYSLADVDAGSAPRPDVVVVPAVPDPAGPVEAPLRSWLTRQAGRGAWLLGVCAGSALLADSGVLDHRQATSFWKAIGGLRRDHPAVQWRSGVRYVEDGRILTTAGVTSGVVGALRMVEKLAGAGEAQRIGAEVAYPGWSLGGTTAIATHRVEPADLPQGLNAAFPWGRPTVGIGLNPGVGELDVAAAFEVYSGTSFAATGYAIAAGRTFVTRHGVVLIAEPATAAAPTVDRFIVPGVRDAAALDPALTAWAADRRLPVDLPDRQRANGEFSFDPVLRDLATHADRATARTTAKYTEYPAGNLRLAGTPWPVRSTLLAIIALALAMGAGIGAGFLPTAVGRMRARRRREAGITVDPAHAAQTARAGVA